MGSAEAISFSEVRASTQWQTRRETLQTRCDQSPDRSRQQLPDPQTTLAEVSEAA